MGLTKEQILLGVGYLQWPRAERRNSRYGTVRLYKNNPQIDESSPMVDFTTAPSGLYGKINAEVLETQESSHIGDLVRGLYPQTPEIGELYDLGEGFLFVERDEYSTVVGLKPLDPREHDWLNPQMLYRLHDQRVRLCFTEIDLISSN